MNKRSTICIAVISVSFLSKAQDRKLERPNILFILSDDHAKSAISIYGGINAQMAPTPNIDKIGREGAVFNNMLCTNSISGPSRACLITGKYSHKNGFYQNEGGIIFDNTQPTSATILQKAGYNTALLGKWHLFSEPKGFDYYKILSDPSQQGQYWNPVYSENGDTIQELGYEGNITTRDALKWLQSGRDKSKPFMMMLHYKAPHRPWEPDSIYEHLWENEDFPYPATFDDNYKTREKTAGLAMATVENHLSRFDLKQVPPAGLSPEEAQKWGRYGGSGENQFWTPDSALLGHELKKWKFQQYIKSYLRTVRSVDDNVGRVLNYLKENGLEENTIVIYMGDQGFFLGEHGWYDKRWMYEESIQMPCLIRYPKAVKAGIQINNLAANIDIAPTLLNYAGLDVPKDMQGKSLAPLLHEDKKEQKKWRKGVYYQYYEYPKWHKVLPHYGIRTDKYKLIHFYYTEDLWEFYDLKRDPNELTNAIRNPEYRKVIKQLKYQLYREQRRLDDDMPLDQRKAMTDKFSVNY